MAKENFFSIVFGVQTAANKFKDPVKPPKPEEEKPQQSEVKPVVKSTQETLEMAKEKNKKINVNIQTTKKAEKDNLFDVLFGNFTPKTEIEKTKPIQVKTEEKTKVSNVIEEKSLMQSSQETLKKAEEKNKKISENTQTTKKAEKDNIFDILFGNFTPKTEIEKTKPIEVKTEEKTKVNNVVEEKSKRTEEKDEKISEKIQTTKKAEKDNIFDVLFGNFTPKTEIEKT
eukprot:CAMPEP_0194166658 /NCGR_PEP_ID=MMETSP0154-20130528/2202_1 /TAXON_ID=1049557 /ORGANISM="Thalassiothrix antarctica, Strain L6-D1" /LENGTH=227 /DNA_ID=CAMNT_0038877387 /DNA_START=52 /DNA_END=731 /DNA_ORIENTATION=+